MKKYPKSHLELGLGDGSRRRRSGIWKSSRCRRTENVLGTLMRAYDREDMIISTKFTPQIAGEEEDPVAEMCEGSLKRLGVDCIDLYWIHNPAELKLA